jgi:uncharacterized protein (DUF1697 family)
METYIALLGGINVGSRNRLSMATAKERFESLGYRDVRTCIQSGNVVYSASERDPGRIGEALATVLGSVPTVLLLDRAGLGNVISGNPFPNADGKALHCFFFESLPRHPDLGKLEALKGGTEEYVLSEKVLYLHAPKGIGRSPLAASVGRVLGVPVTARNWNTVGKLAVLAS